MNKREIVNRSIANMEMFYKDIGRIMKLIEEQMINKKYKALGNAAVTWENSASLYNSDSWLPVWFARVYSKSNTSKRAVGFCIHLGGERYMENDYNNVINGMDLKLPVMSVSVLETTKALSKLNKKALYDVLWHVVFSADSTNVKDNKFIDTELEMYEEFKATTYFIDIFSLTSGDKISELVINPMDQLYKKNEEYILKSKIPVIEVNQLINESDESC